MTKILIVDDDDLALEALHHLLTRAGYEVITKTNGVEALEELQAGECRLVVSDWMMPEMDGVELCRQIRKQDFPGYVYVILLTSRDRQEDTLEGLSAGADDFVTKPFEPAELLARIRIGERILSLETRDVAIFAMAKLAESRDPETGEHLERMRSYSRIITEFLANDDEFDEPIHEDFPRLIYLTSPLHDIGKVGIPDCVLLKPGRLSDREFEIMKTHTTIGAATLDAAVRQYPGVAYLLLARNIALTHHERFDGSGYPGGLVGRDIPLCGRIVALADVYDALTSKRVYKQAFAHDISRSMILEESGKHFDPNVARAFIHCEEQFLDVRGAHAELELSEVS
jgi:putative two-component system response regulator